MQQYFIDFSLAKTLADVHAVLASSLSLSGYYGRNGDALWDCLTGQIEPGRIRIRGRASLLAAAPVEGAVLISVFDDVSKEPLGYIVEWLGDESPLRAGDAAAVADDASVEIHCRVCGFEDREFPAWFGAGGGSFDFCACCGVQHGYGDGLPAAARRWRQQWMDGGCLWNDASARPENWDMQRQLANIPAAFR